MKVTIEPHSGIDKSFLIEFEELSLSVNYDDVNHAEVDAAAKYLKELIERHWDSNIVKIYYREELISEWNKNEYNLQSDYESLNDYMEQHGFNQPNNTI